MLLLLFFKQKTAYAVRIIDWSSDVCSSDLPLAFLRDELRARKMISCEELQSVKDGRWINLAGVVLVRQKPGSAKGVMRESGRRVGKECGSTCRSRCTPDA